MHRNYRLLGGEPIFYNLRVRTNLMILFHLRTPETRVSQLMLLEFFNNKSLKIFKVFKVFFFLILCFFSFVLCFLLEREKKRNQYEPTSMGNSIPYKMMFVSATYFINWGRRCIFSGWNPFFQEGEDTS